MVKDQTITRTLVSEESEDGIQDLTFLSVPVSPIGGPFLEPQLETILYLHKVIGNRDVFQR